MAYRRYRRYRGYRSRAIRAEEIGEWLRKREEQRPILAEITGSPTLQTLCCGCVFQRDCSLSWISDLCWSFLVCSSCDCFPRGVLAKRLFSSSNILPSPCFCNRLFCGTSIFGIARTSKLLLTIVCGDGSDYSNDLPSPVVLLGIFRAGGRRTLHSFDPLTERIPPPES